MAERNLRKERVGVVVSDKMDKSVVVSVERQLKHSIYGRIIRLKKRYKAHDDKNECKVGDKVRILETRPLSKTKRWRIGEIIERAK
ncbi:30S ribosomal protein S17 [Chitinispirillales bacterium ANBcel5]|uniref:30S ribosomal protein S17 n=1 Tax=Cellulosispirillum alkaliphilum TaxID=3039283 RepID=UPI002A544AD4|nr:30S ribosomal protein S17 [Chitinispirillales bacterium ANBcel5]